MRYAIIGVVLLVGCSFEPPPPLTAEDVLQRKVTGRQWLAHDIEVRRTISDELAASIATHVLESRKRAHQETAAFLIAEFRNLEQALREHECVDRPQEVCTLQQEQLTAQMMDFCKRFHATECTEAGMSAGLDALFEQEHANAAVESELEAYDCATKLETLDRAARGKRQCPVLQRAFISCGDAPPICFFCTECELP